MVNIAVLREISPGENRVAANPETVKKYVQWGAQVTVQRSAGVASGITDDEFRDAGAAISATSGSVLKKSDFVLKIHRPTPEETKHFKAGSCLLALLNPFDNAAELKALADAKVTAFAMELMPRITRAQSMDILSSQANLAGYRAVIDASSEYGRALPMMMTAAGTVPAARIFIMGAGVAGLQAIATARRLGAIVSATDVRPAAKEQVESLGGKFIAVEDEEFRQSETAGGYAKPMSEDYQKKQAALIAEHIKQQDIVITTALIPGRPAPRLLNKEMVSSMRPGSVVVDMALERGGNVEGAKPDQIVTISGAKIIGYANIPSRIAASASSLYARNLFAFAQTLVNPKDGKLSIDWDDELVKATLLTHDGRKVHPMFQDEGK